MKEIIAIIRMDMINQTKEALSIAGFPSMTCRKVQGRGKKKVDYELIESLISGEKIETSSKKMEMLSEAHRLIPKRMITMIVKDEDVKKVIDIIIEVNQTGNMGDGKIFVIPIEEVIRVRTGETGEIAI
ncbi:P-II family nitrogen regulator [Defluviitalea phaphyphila]|uniref:P-II family nitrogen regulator n=1 Tax=Defluviitalea phaphyphila TaxID=1473580 RepID=UPI0007307AA8|nr:P-II family nitrogen regulator [Defluviitalea phaphyphila]